jgi:hypothetical protein
MPAFDLRPTNDSERKLLDAWTAGEQAIIAAGAPVVRASFIRYLLLGLAVPVSRIDPSVAGRLGIRVRGARIEGPLDFSDCTGSNGSALPPLVLERCTIPDPIDLSGGHFARVSIANSQITHVCARGMRLDGNLDFSGVRGIAPTAGGASNRVAWIDAHGARIGGDVEGRRARLRAPPNRAEGQIPPRMQRYALRLSNAEVLGRVILLGGFRANGGVNVGDSDIRGEVWLSGARVSAGEGLAFGARGTRFGSTLLLDEGFSARGEVGLWGAKIAGTFRGQGATFRNRNGAALGAENAEIGGDVLLRGENLNVSGLVNLMGARIGGDLDCNDATFENRSEDGNHDVLLVERAHIGGNALLGGQKFRAVGRISLNGAKISGSLDCDDATFSNPEGITVNVANAEIGGGWRLERAVSIGGMYCLGARIGRDLNATSARFLCHSYQSYALFAPNLQVGGDCLLTNATVVGDLFLPHLELTGALDWTELRLPERERDSDATPPQTYEAPLREAPEGLPLSREQRRWSFWNLQHARIGTELRAESLTTEVFLDIDLGGAHVATLSDKWSEGWGGSAAEPADESEPRRVSLNLDGLIYDRIGNFPTDRRGAGLAARVDRFIDRLREKVSQIESTRTEPRVLTKRFGVVIALFWHKIIHRFGRFLGTLLDWFRRRFCSERHSAESRLKWLQLQRAPVGSFFPQPYHQLARVLRAHGHVEAAREVGIAEGWAGPARLWYRWFGLPSLFGKCFGFGLAPLSAFLTLVGFAAVGTIGTYCALYLSGGAMVVATMPVASVLAEDEVGPHAAIWGGYPIPAIIEPRCSDQIVPIFYVFDLMLPAIPLHEETKCDVSIRPEFRAWRWAKQVFSILGKIVTALALLTFSGVLNVRPQD